MASLDLLVIWGSLMVLQLSSTVSAANILATAIYGEGSHFSAMSAICQGLVQRGHNITFLISRAYEHRAEDPKFSNFSFEIFNHPVPLEEVRDMFDAVNKLAFVGQDTQTIQLMSHFNHRMVEDCEYLLADKDFMSRMENMDVLLIDVTWACGYYIKEVLNRDRAKPKNMTMITTTSALPWSAFLRSSGSPFNYAYQPEVTTGFSNKMTFFQRVKNIITSAAIYVMLDTITIDLYRDMGKRLGLTSRFDIIKSYSESDLFLTHMDFASDFPIALNPNVIDVGGVTASHPSPLTAELEEFMQSSGDHGVIILTLGSYLVSLSTLRPDIVVTFAEAFRRLPQKVIWHLKELPDWELPPNVKTMPWLPQNDLLGHPKTRVMIYHGGNNGFQEACYHGVPLVVIPMHSDQYDIATRVEVRGFGKKIDKLNLSADLVYEILREVTNNASYRSVAQKVSAIYQDRPMSAVDRAAFWIEHVIKYGGSYMRSPANDLNFVQYHLIDVYAFLTSVLILFFVVVYYVLRLCFSLCCRLIGSSDSAKAKTE